MKGWEPYFQLGLLSLMESMSFAFLKCSKASLISTVLANNSPLGIFLSGHIPLSCMKSSLFSLRLVCIFISFPMKPILLFITSTLNWPPGTGIYLFKYGRVKCLPIYRMHQGSQNLSSISHALVHPSIKH